MDIDIDFYYENYINDKSNDDDDKYYDKKKESLHKYIYNDKLSLFDKYIIAPYPFSDNIKIFIEFMIINLISTVVIISSEDENIFSLWPKSEEEKKLGKYSISLLNEKNQKNFSIINKSFIVKYDNEIKKINIINYHGWNNGGVPDKKNDLIELINIIRNDKYINYPLLICSKYGLDRPSSFVCIINTIDNIQNQTENINEEYIYEIISLVMSTIQKFFSPYTFKNYYQYDFCHKFIKYYYNIE